MKVYFERLGHLNVSFVKECKGDLTYEWLYKQVKPYCMSRDMEFRYNEETGEGIIIGGFQTIGGFKIEYD